jgi:hypothetical protein
MDFKINWVGFAIGGDGGGQVPDEIVSIVVEVITRAVR